MIDEEEQAHEDVGRLPFWISHVVPTKRASTP
jgi:hypothetical protein